jgi:mono/diheme cytochrome c family protein
MNAEATGTPRRLRTADGGHPRRSGWMRLVAAVVLLAAGCELLDPNPGPGPFEPPPPAPDPVSAAFGAAVFAQNCARCHGPEGRGADVYPLPIVGCQNVAEVTIEGSGAMPAFPDLSDEACQSLQLYLDSLDTVYHLNCP